MLTAEQINAVAVSPLKPDEAFLLAGSHELGLAEGLEVGRKVVAQVLDAGETRSTALVRRCLASSSSGACPAWPLVSGSYALRSAAARPLCCSSASTLIIIYNGGKLEER
jgi:hypothetical protein